VVKKLRKKKMDRMEEFNVKGRKGAT